MTIPNPFEMLENKLDRLQASVDRLIAMHDSVRPEWEAIQVSVATRRKGRRTLLAAVQNGLIRFKHVATRGAKAGWLLSVADLDQHFPPLRKNGEVSRYPPSQRP